MYQCLLCIDSIWQARAIPYGCLNEEVRTLRWKDHAPEDNCFPCVRSREWNPRGWARLLGNNLEKKVGSGQLGHSMLWIQLHVFILKQRKQKPNDGQSITLSLGVWSYSWLFFTLLFFGGPPTQLPYKEVRKEEGSWESKERTLWRGSEREGSMVGSRWCVGEERAGSVGFILKCQHVDWGKSDRYICIKSAECSWVKGGSERWFHWAVLRSDLWLWEWVAQVRWGKGHWKWRSWEYEVPTWMEHLRGC